jgi:hypothetical protein
LHPISSSLFLFQPRDRDSRNPVQKGRTSEDGKSSHSRTLLPSSRSPIREATVTAILSAEEPRSRAAELVNRYSSGYRTDGLLVVEIIDAVCTDVLRVAGVTEPSDARSVLASLWAPR